MRFDRDDYAGGVFRGSAKRIKVELERSLGHRGPWVQAVVVVWGAFRQRHHEEEDVVYVAGDQLIPWLAGLRPRLNAPQRAALVTALKEARTALKTTPSFGGDAATTPAQTDLQTNDMRRVDTPRHEAARPVVK
jgi:hypothetical protein